MAGELLTSAVVSKVQDIKDFLAKPYPFRTGILSSTDAAGTFSTIQIPSDILATDIFFQKLKGNLGIRADMIFRLQVNANRFQQGRYILYYMPGVYSGTQNFTPLFNARAATLTQVTCLPHVEIDIACDTEAILRVPFNSWSTHWSILDQSPTSGAGLIQLRPYVPIASNGGSSDAEYTLWTYFENIEIVAPTLAQMDMHVKKSTVSASEQKSQGLGPISSFATKVKSSAKLVSQVPVLSQVAGMVSWASDIVGGVASIWGWSNPLDLSNVGRMVQTIFPYANNVDTADESMPLSFYARNEIEVLDSVGGTSIDEMNINHIISIPAFYKQVNITTANDYNTVLWSETLAPGQFYQQFTDSAVPFRTYTPLGYMSRFFSSWRGSIGFKLKFVKTEFHSARFILSFAPYQTSHANWNVTDTPYLFREIIDLRLGNEFTVIIPYTSLKPYRSVETLQPYGTVMLHVLNELKAPGTVPSTINLLIEPFAANDFELAFPRTPDAFPYLPLAIAQIDMGGEDNSCQISSTYIGGAQPNPDSLAPSRFCIGEKIMSVLSLLKHASNIKPTLSYFNATSTVYVARAFYCTSNILTSISSSPLRADNYTYFGLMYAYSRGSLRFRNIYTPGSTLVGSLLGKTLAGTAAIPSYSSSASTLISLAGANDPVVFQSTGFRCGSEVTIPFYNDSYIVPHQWFIDTSLGTGSTIATPAYTLPIETLNIRLSTSASPSTVSRQAGDDFQFMSFCGGFPLTGTNY